MRLKLKNTISIVGVGVVKYFEIEATGSLLFPTLVQQKINSQEAKP